MGALDTALVENYKTEKKKPYGKDNQGNADPFTKNGYDKSEVVSALQKAIRRNMEPQALYWASELMESGEGYRMWRRLIVIAAEDVGLADPDMVMRIMAMKQAHDMGREWNIPFLAIMLLCRANKNREADDAAWLYEVKRKEGWKIPMPPEAVDGHTGRGRRNLYENARQRGEDWNMTWNYEFYYDAALLKNYTPIESGGVEERYRKALCEHLKIPFKTYDIDTCDEVRLLTGNRSGGPDRSVFAGKVPEGGPQFEPVTNTETGEVIPNQFNVKSFTGGEQTYLVDLDREECTCPAFQHSEVGAPCKHIMIMRRAAKATT